MWRSTTAVVASALVVWGWARDNHPRLRKLRGGNTAIGRGLRIVGVLSGAAQSDGSTWLAGFYPLREGFSGRSDREVPFGEAAVAVEELAVDQGALVTEQEA